MQIAEIIDEIDAFLSRLRQARELLSGYVTEAQEKSPPRRKRKVLVRQVETAFSSRRPAEKYTSRSTPSVAHRKRKKERGEPAAQVSSAVPSQASPTEQPAIVGPEPAVPQGVVITRLPVRRQIGSIRSMRHRTAKSAVSTKLDSTKPAIALAGPLNTKIVVVSAEQVLREREQTARPAVLRPRTAAVGLTGRKAFEALFSNQIDRPKTSGQ